MAYGGALAVSALVGAVSGLFLGRLIDSGRGARAVWIAGGVLTLVNSPARRSRRAHPLLAVLANALGAFVACLYVPTMMTAVYNQAKRSPCVMRFHIAAEGGWDVGVTTGLSLSAMLVWLGFSIAHTILLSLVGAAFTLGIAAPLLCDASVGVRRRIADAGRRSGEDMNERISRRADFGEVR